MTVFFGHEGNRRQIDTRIALGKLHHGWILGGPRGIGKAHFAKQVAAKLVDPEGKFERLVEQGTHPDIITISRLPKEALKEGEVVTPQTELKRSISVDQIRTLQGQLTTRPGIGDKRAIIINSADDLERNAANALLKSLEEPSQGTHFFLISHASDRLLPTIRSRCQILRFEPLTELEMREALKQALPDVSGLDLASLVAAGAGAPGQAMEFAGLDLAELDNLMSAIIQTGDKNNKLRSNLSEKLALKAAQGRYEAFLRRAPQMIAAQARQTEVAHLEGTVDAWQQANSLAKRAITLNLDKQSVVFHMGSLLAAVQPHKHR